MWLRLQVQKDTLSPASPSRLSKGAPGKTSGGLCLIINQHLCNDVAVMRRTPHFQLGFSFVLLSVSVPPDAYGGVAAPEQPDHRQ